jgi:hypothetical protein
MSFRVLHGKNPLTVAYNASRVPTPPTDAERAANAAALAAQPAADAEQRAQALKVFRAYSGADSITKAKIRGEYGDSVITAGRRIHDETQSPEPTGPEAA